MPQTPWIIYGFVPNLGIGVTVTGENLTTGETESVVSASDGSFVLDAANMLPTGYNAETGDIIRITAPGYYAEVVVDVALYPDGKEISLTNNPITVATVIPSGVMGKFPASGDMRMGFPGGVSVGRSGLG